MEDLVESYIVKAGYQKNVNYFKEIYLSDIEKEKLNIEKSYEKNSLEKNAIINSIKSIKNLF